MCKTFIDLSKIGGSILPYWLSVSIRLYVLVFLQVICVGQIVCAVVADSEVHAKQAAAKVNIEYEALEPVILTIEVIKLVNFVSFGFNVLLRILFQHSLFRHF